MRKSLGVRVVVAFAGLFAALVLAAPASGATETAATETGAAPALVRATQNNDCKLNVRAGADTGSPILHTLTCDNYTTCVQADEQSQPCGPYVVGGDYSCVGADNKQVYDNKWAEVSWRSPEPAYVAVSCAFFRE
ncbi:hypothetical protein SAMN05421630_102169 [Prauserella marina]|uniref:Uncharacterized protein n=1 Tax=Prauserella marina TaxID=530584 RepID=A0A1G6LQC8_9PSEU|nr:hypothetical protein [Prauserella marina]PWV85793.1 hypothetical protein DES30_1011823 [Prauserella marina]SDC45399.1 hypothetical protein SAMN05421630_102169 [Prauserella marina]